MSSLVRALLLSAAGVFALPCVAFAQDFAPSEPMSQPSDEWQDPDIDAFYPRRGHAAFKVSANGGVRSFEESDDAFIGGASAFVQIRFRAAKESPKVDGGTY